MHEILFRVKDLTKGKILSASHSCYTSLKLSPHGALTYDACIKELRKDQRKGSEHFDVKTGNSTVKKSHSMTFVGDGIKTYTLQRSKLYDRSEESYGAWLSIESLIRWTFQRL
ncbi:hypothetical protein RRG08_003387 [Elysia crispata]|uniref:Uncharacterized protein n=1 Tax=Elysia crispata TaxID=231223 RepID=A0AAE1AAZ8_9GAST|nr:hypothetical protein RRG08_003387 [Elysia crispata]